jgi:hypothetical protein
MYSEPNLHSRNLKLISLLFVFYWILGLHPADDTIRLIAVNYEIDNPQALAWIASTLLFYFAWRFYLNSKHKIMASFRTKASIYQIQDRESRLFIKLKKICGADYKLNQKDKYEKERVALAAKKDLENFNNQEYHLNPYEFKYEQKHLQVTYQVNYEGERLESNDFRDYIIRFKWYQFIFFKIIKFAKFIFQSEDSPDYLIPWLLFLLAVTSCIFIQYDFTFSDFKSLLDVG